MVCLTAKDSKKLLLETDLGPFLVALRTFRVKGVAGSQVLFLTQTKPRKDCPNSPESGTPSPPHTPGRMAGGEINWYDLKLTV